MASSRCKEYPLEEFLKYVKNDLSDSKIRQEHQIVLDHQSYYKDKFQHESLKFDIGTVIPSEANYGKYISNENLNFGNNLTNSIVLNSFYSKPIDLSEDIFNSSNSLVRIFSVPHPTQMKKETKEEIQHNDLKIDTGNDEFIKNDPMLLNTHINRMKKQDVMVYFVSGNEKQFEPLFPRSDRSNRQKYKKFDYEFDYKQRQTEYFDFFDCIKSYRHERIIEKYNEQFQSQNYDESKHKSKSEFHEIKTESYSFDRLVNQLDNVKNCKNLYKGELKIDEKNIRIYVFTGITKEGLFNDLNSFLNLYLEISKIRENMGEEELLKMGLMSIDGKSKLGPYLMFEIIAGRLDKYYETYGDLHFKLSICNLCQRMARYKYGICKYLEEYEFLYISVYEMINLFLNEIKKNKNKINNDNTNQDQMEIDEQTPKAKEIEKFVKMTNKYFNKYFNHQ